MGRDNREVGQHGDAHRHSNGQQATDLREKLQRDAHGKPQTKGTTGEGTGKPIVNGTGGEGSGPPTTTSNPPGEGTGPPGEGSGPPGGGHHEKTPPIIFIPPWKPPITVTPITPPPIDTTPIIPNTKNPPTVLETPEIPVLLKTPPIIPTERNFTKDITVSDPKPKDPGLVPPPPTGVFTGQGGDGPEMERKYKRLYTSGKYSAQSGEENLSAPSLGLNHIKVEPVGTGA